MAGKKENIKALFSNSRSRVIILFTVAVLLITVLIGFIKFGSSAAGPESSVSLGNGAAGISATPGSMNQTAQYAALQETQNIEQANLARKTGTSAIPTIIRTQAFGVGVQIIGQKEGQGGVDFSALTQAASGYTPQSTWIQSLKDNSCSKVSLASAIDQGTALSELRPVCSCEQLTKNGYTLSQLEPVCSCAELKAAGFNIEQMKNGGFTAGALRLCGYVACAERAAGFTAQEMKDAGYSDGELKGAGFTDSEIARAGGVPDGITVDDIRKAECSVEALSRLRAAGVTAAAIRRISGCSALALKAAGFTAADLKNAGFSAADLKRAGFPAAQLKQAGFSARDLLNAGLTGDELPNAGFSPMQIKEAESILPLGLTPNDIKNAGCSVDAIKRERLAGVSAALISEYANCNLNALKQAGFSDNDLLNAGFKPADLNAAATAAPLKDASAMTDDAIRAAGCDPMKLKVLFAQGVTAKRIHDLNGCSAEALKNAGFDAKSLADAGFTPSDLLAAGFSPAQLLDAGLSPVAVVAAGRTADCSVSSLQTAHSLGVSATTIEQTLGCSATALKDAGYSAADLKNAGFTAAELKNAGFGLNDLKNAGYSAKELAAAGWTAQELKNAGFDAQQLKNAGFSAQQLKDAGFPAQELKNAGFSAADTKNAGFSAAQLKAVGFGAGALKEAGFSADALRSAGLSAKDMKAAGFSLDQLQQAGYPVQDLRDAGYSALVGLAPVSSALGQSSTMPSLPSIDGGVSNQSAAQAASIKRMEDVRTQQEKQMAAQRFQQKIQQRGTAMLTAANQSMQGWKVVPQQTYVAGSVKKSSKGDSETESGAVAGMSTDLSKKDVLGADKNSDADVVIKMGDVLFAVIDTSVNSDEPGPILATIVSGKLKGSKLIGSFNLPSNADKMVVTFNSLSIPGVDKTVSITAFAIDPNTARTALSSQTDHHYLSRYGALFASTFIEGFGNAIQSANTTITIGGTGGTTDTTVSNGVGLSTMENAVIGLATVGKAWGQVAAQQMHRPTTVDLFSGTGVGVLFTQDLKIS